MSERTFRQFYGPSERYPHGCVEMRFPLGARREARLAPLEPVLLGAGLKLVEFLPDEPLPLDAAVCRLASALLARHAVPWTDHGQDGDSGWVALAYPFPKFAAQVLAAAHALASTVGPVPQPLAAQLPPVADWLRRVNYIEMWMLAAAQVFGRETAILNTTTGIYQVGLGAKGVHYLELGNSRDAFTGMLLENSKRTTIETLQRLALPTTRGIVVSKTDQAVQAAQAVGLPCVVKPLSMSKGAGVAPGLETPAQVAAAVTTAIRLSKKPVLVENHVEGQDHRLTIIGDELLWVYRKVPAHVTGDGKASVRELIAKENARRAGIRSGTEAYLYQIALDDELATFLKARYGLTLGSVLDRKQRIELAGQANIARGGYLEDVTPHVHPDNRELGIRVARLFKMHALGIDYITPDIARSWKEVETAIIEVNRTPGISGMGDATLVHRTMFPNRRSGAVPTVGVIGDAAYRAAAAEVLAGAFAGKGLKLASAEYLPDRPGAQAVKTLAMQRAVEALVLDPEAEAMAVLCDPGAVERAGFPLQRCDVLLVEDARRFAWLEPLAGTVLKGAPAAAKLNDIAGKLARLAADPAEGGALPVLEPGPEAKDTFHLTVWRTRAMPREWFWREVGAPAPEAFGMTDHTDLLAAVRALAGLKDDFTHGEIVGPWFRVTFEAAIALPARNKGKARAALLEAVARVNAICAARIV